LVLVSWCRIFYPGESNYNDESMIWSQVAINTHVQCTTSILVYLSLLLSLLCLWKESIRISPCTMPHERKLRKLSDWNRTTFDLSLFKIYRENSIRGFFHLIYMKHILPVGLWYSHKICFMSLFSCRRLWVVWVYMYFHTSIYKLLTAR